MRHGARRPHYSVTFGILAIAALTYSLLQSLVVPALREIQIDLHTTTSSVAWVLTAYLLSASVATPILGRLGDMFGKKRLLVVALAIVGAGTLIAALASSIGPMVVGRALQGAGGAVFPLAYGIIRDEFPRARVAGGIALISAILGIGGGLGTVLAGPITTHLSYHWLFWLPLVFTVAAALGALLVIPESPVRRPGRIDFTGALLLSGWLTALLVGISQGASWGWGSGRTLGLFLLSGVIFAVWIGAEVRISPALVDMRMMRLRGVWTTNATAVLLGFGMFASFVLVPQFVEMPESTGYGFGASVTGGSLYLLPMTGTMLVFSLIAGRLSSTTGSKSPLVFGTLVAAIALALLAAAHGRPWEVFTGTTLMGVGIGLTFSAMANLIVEAVPSEQTGVATGMNTIMRSIGGALGSQVCASIVASVVATSGLPRESGFTAAFAVSAAVLVAALAASLAVPRRQHGLAASPALAPARAE
jgi:MFS family permease